ncbi:MAG: cobalamin-dependent protein, partial [Hyphomicrobiaceae bacterium]
MAQRGGAVALGLLCEEPRHGGCGAGLMGGIRTPVPAVDPSWLQGLELLSEGRALARDWHVEPRAFLKTHDVACEADHKTAVAQSGRIMQHAQVGFRDPGKTRRAFAEIYDACQARGVTVDRYGICLDWSMAVPRADRDRAQTGTGLILSGAEDFVSLGEAAPVAPHFGDFVLGFPAAVENTQAALAAGSTAIGNLGQYFTFRAPGFEDDVVATEATLRALGLIAAQERTVLVHSNLDDGFAAQFTDLASCLGAVLLEQDIFGRLAGCTVSHCYGHHFTDPVRRMAFQLALAEVNNQPGTMIYGSTMSYQGTPAENYASLGSYLMTDALGQMHKPSGHAINPVPVMENNRIPDVDEIVDAQLFAHRMVEEVHAFRNLVDVEAAQKLAIALVAGGRTFFRNVQTGFADAGIDTDDAFQMMIALRRMGGHALETAFGAGEVAVEGKYRTPVVQASLVDEIDAMAAAALSRVPGSMRNALQSCDLHVLTASTDVHAHGKMALDSFLMSLGVEVLDGGMTADAKVLADTARDQNADAI